MTDAAAEMATVFQQLHKLFKGSPGQVGALASGSSRLVIIGPGQEVVDRRPGLKSALLFARKLTSEEAAQIDSGQARIRLVRKGGRIQYPLDLGETAAAVRQLLGAEAIVKYLDSDSRLVPAKLRQLGYELNIEVPAKLRSRGDIQFHLAQVLAGHQARSGGTNQGD
ncbi:hypothetical protein [Actinoplanes sp. M2I2]|uniref:hypothetical protein n=1 Tax=Actinoplanes sp. M2I2 TaxID=1734444 RepID=UPI0020209A51|nr:hypothetical protein [Actinoplanes sp. M2I2]